MPGAGCAPVPFDRDQGAGAGGGYPDPGGRIGPRGQGGRTMARIFAGAALALVLLGGCSGQPKDGIGQCEPGVGALSQTLTAVPQKGC